jgi:hypothetical protein
VLSPWPVMALSSCVVAVSLLWSVMAVKWHSHCVSLLWPMMVVMWLWHIVASLSWHVVVAMLSLSLWHIVVAVLSSLLWLCCLHCCGMLSLCPIVVVVVVPRQHVFKNLKNSSYLYIYSNKKHTYGPDDARLGQPLNIELVVALSLPIVVVVGAL